jgi:hypothetical protein
MTGVTGYPFDNYDGSDESFEKLQEQVWKGVVEPVVSQRLPVVCGDCGGDLSGAPGEEGPRTHLDDGSPQCKGRRDAIRRKPGHFCCLECGQPPNERHLDSCVNPTGEAGGKVVATGAAPVLVERDQGGDVVEVNTVSCLKCQAEIHLVNPAEPDGAWNDWGCSQLCAGTSDKHNPQWSTAQLQRDFEVKGFAMYMCVATRRADGKLGSLDFTHRPRFYYGFIEHTP